MCLDFLDGLSWAFFILDEYLPPVVQHQHDPDEDGGQLQDGDLVPRGGHAAQAACGAGELGAHGGECVGLETIRILVSDLLDIRC